MSREWLKLPNTGLGSFRHLLGKLKEMKTTYFGIQAHESPCSRPIIAERESEKSPRAGPGREIKRDEQKSGFFLFPSIGMSARRRSERDGGGAVFGQRARARSPGIWRPNESIGDGAGPAALNPPQQNVGLIALIYPTSARVFHELGHNSPFTLVQR